MQLQLREHGQPGLCHTRHRKRMAYFPCNDFIVQGKLKSKKARKTVDTFLLRIIQQLKLFRIIVFSNQLSLYGAVANMCEEFEFHQDRSEQSDVLMGQSIVLSEINAEVPFQNENPSYQNVLWQQYIERIKLLSQENRVSIFCIYAGFMRIVVV